MELKFRHRRARKRHSDPPFGVAIAPKIHTMVTNQEPSRFVSFLTWPHQRPDRDADLHLQHHFLVLGPLSVCSGQPSADPFPPRGLQPRDDLDRGDLDRGQQLRNQPASQDQMEHSPTGGPQNRSLLPRDFEITSRGSISSRFSTCSIAGFRSYAFFLKNELRYVPFLGAAWKALDFPFMKRYSRDYLEKHPEKRGEDLQETKRACEKLRGKPISILNFLEGTRLTPSKHEKSKSTFRHLLPPKAGGIAFVIEAMGEQFDSILDITIHYPGGAKSLWGLFSGQIHEITVWVEQIAIPREILGGNYFNDDAFRNRMQNWIQEIWTRKDQRLAEF